MKKAGISKVMFVLMALVSVVNFTGCKKKNASSSKPILKVGMECAYAPFNWTQNADKTPDGTAAVPIFREK